MEIGYLIAFVVLAAVAVAIMRFRNSGARGHVDQRHDPIRPRADYVEDRETARLAHMSADDRAWETASLQRNHASNERSAAAIK